VQDYRNWLELSKSEIVRKINSIRLMKVLF